MIYIYFSDSMICCIYFRDTILQSQNPEAILSTTLSEKVIDMGIHYHPSLKHTERFVCLAVSFIIPYS